MVNKVVNKGLVIAGNCNSLLDVVGDHVLKLFFRS